MSKTERRPAAGRPTLYAWTAMAAGLVLLVRVMLTMEQISHTFDEPAHIGAGMAAIEARKHIYDLIHPPFARIWAAVPLVVAGVELPEARHVTVMGPTYAFEAGQKILTDGPLEYDSALTRSREMMLVFPVVALFYLYRLGNWLGNQLTATLSVVFLSCDPNFIANSGLVTTDLPAVAGFLVIAYHGLRWIIHRSVGEALLAGAACGLAIGFKYSCIFVPPALFLFMLVRPLPVLWRRCGQASWKVYLRRWPPLWQMAIALATALFVLWATFLFNVDPLMSQRVMGASAVWTALPNWIKSVPIPMPSLVFGLWSLLHKSPHGSPSYLMGEIGTHGWWYFFPMTIVLKSPIGFLASLGLAIVLWIIGPQRRVYRSLAILSPPALYLAFSITSNLNFGLRHVLPLMPFLYLFVCFHLARGKRIYLLLPLMLLSMMESVLIHPHYLSFFNMAAGGPANGSRYLLDCNLDWGQDTRQMARWLSAESRTHDRPYSVRVFGGKPGYLKSFHLDSKCASGPLRGLFAISKTIRGRLYKITIGPDGETKLPPDYEWLNNYPIVHRIGYSIDIYDLGVDVWDVRGDPARYVRIVSQPSHVEAINKSGKTWKRSLEHNFK